MKTLLSVCLLAVSIFAQTPVQVQHAQVYQGSLGFDLQVMNDQIQVYPSTVPNGVFLRMTTQPAGTLYAIVGFSTQTMIYGGLVTSTDFVVNRGAVGTGMRDEIVSCWDPPFYSGSNVFVQYAVDTGSTVYFSDQVLILL